MMHPCAQEHPYLLTDVPADVLEAWWSDALDGEWFADAGVLIAAWYLIPQPRVAA